VLIRSRKPCVFLRLRLFGWYVRFTNWPPRGPRAGETGSAREAGGSTSLRAGAVGSQRVRAAERAGIAPSATPCRPSRAVLRCAPRTAAAGRADFPGGAREDPTGRARQDRGTATRRTGRRARRRPPLISTPVDVPVEEEAAAP
jgi:hypothetical protein